jgi:hypothetical protein
MIPGAGWPRETKAAHVAHPPKGQQLALIMRDAHLHGPRYLEAPLPVLPCCAPFSGVLASASAQHVLNAPALMLLPNGVGVWV